LQTQQSLDRYLQWVVGLHGIRLIPPAMVLRIEAYPTPPCIEMPLDILFARVVEQDGAVSKFILVGCDAEHIRRQHQRRLALISLELMYCLAPVLRAGDVALVLGDDERDAIDQQRSILATLSDALNAVLVTRRKVVEVLSRRIEG